MVYALITSLHVCGITRTRRGGVAGLDPKAISRGIASLCCLARVSSGVVVREGRVLRVTQFLDSHNSLGASTVRRSVRWTVCNAWPNCVGAVLRTARHTSPQLVESHQSPGCGIPHETSLADACQPAIAGDTSRDVLNLNGFSLNPVALTLTRTSNGARPHTIGPRLGLDHDSLLWWFCDSSRQLTKAHNDSSREMAQPCTGEGNDTLIDVWNSHRSQIA